MNVMMELQNKGIELEQGLSINEIAKIEKEYNLKFPEELKEFFMICLPVSKGFYNWRNFNDDNIKFIKDVMATPYNDISSDTADIEWSEAWGEEPTQFEEREKIIMGHLNNAPKLIPLYIHRYIISTEKKSAPIFSIHGTDIICYGESLIKFLKIQFMGTPYDEIEFDKALEIPFWGEIL